MTKQDQLKLLDELVDTFDIEPRSIYYEPQLTERELAFMIELLKGFVNEKL
jgi:hypothetical protein